MSELLENSEGFREATRAQKIAWMLYDWANSGFGLIIAGVMFSNYFISDLLPVVSTSAEGIEKRGLMLGSRLMPASAVIGVMTSIVALLVTLTAPVLGALADLRGWSKGLLMLTATLGSVLAMTSLFLQPGQWVLAAIIYILSSVCFATSVAFYNAFLPVLASPEKQGRLSGWGFGVGYIGGAVALIFAGIIAAKSGSTPLGLAFGGVWWLVFSIPAFFLLPRLAPVVVEASDRSILAQSFGRVIKTFFNVKRYKTLFLFLLAFLVYSNGLDSVINLSPAFGTDVLKMSQSQLIVMFLIVQFVAFVGATVFGYVADRYGNKVVIVSNLVVWCVAVLGVAFVQTPMQFTLLGGMIGLVLGGVQSSSRALMASLAPAEIRNEAFGLFSLSGKAISVFGPLLFSVAATASEDARTGVFAVLPFLVIGLIMIFFVKEPRKVPNP